MAMDPLIHPHTRPSFMEGMLTILLFALSYFFLLDFFSLLIMTLLTLNRLLPSTSLEILIPSSAVTKVLGRNGANLSNIRQVNYDFLV